MDNLSTIRDFVSKTLNLQCEQIGTWIWVTRPNNPRIRQALINQGFEYSKTRRMYYYREPLMLEYPKLTMQQLREKYADQLKIDLGA